MSYKYTSKRVGIDDYILNKIQHAEFSPSQCSWNNYTDEDFIRVRRNRQAAEYGTKLHALAKMMIDEGIVLAPSDDPVKDNLRMYVNDCIKHGMETERRLFYSPVFGGTADAMSFKRKKLIIFDLKTGVKPAKIEQLMNYAALFCLTERKDPSKIAIELRIYQNCEVMIYEPESDEIQRIIDTIVHFDALAIAMDSGEI